MSQFDQRQLHEIYLQGWAGPLAIPKALGPFYYLLWEILEVIRQAAAGKKYKENKPPALDRIFPDHFAFIRSEMLQLGKQYEEKKRWEDYVQREIAQARKARQQARDMADGN